MGLTDPLFLFIFLPACLVLFLICPNRLKNPLLALASLLFYLVGSSPLVLLLSVVLNWGLGLLIERSSEPAERQHMVSLGVAANLLILAYSKYLGFILDNLNVIGLGVSLRSLIDVSQPLGVSFFTFQAIAYLLDIGRGQLRPVRNPLDFFLFTAFFSKAAAGPITRYQEMAERIKAPGTTLEDIGEGAWRFALGMAKKVLIAGTLGPLADAAFERAVPGGSELSMPVAWLGLTAYALQLYFDFAGYTDMAVGLGRMFGFRLPENFDRPYTARSVQEFWRRWHMSLSFWFRDYLYIPLGGNRAGELRTHLNLLIVFALCGLWHGASWAFVFWGVLHGLFLTLERLGLGQRLRSAPRIVSQGYAVAAVMFAWVFFRAETMPQALAYLKALGSFSLDGTVYFMAAHTTPLLLGVMAFAGLLALGDPWRGLRERFSRRLWAEPVRAGLALALLLICAAKTASTTFSPFIYARF